MGSTTGRTSHSLFPVARKNFMKLKDIETQKEYALKRGKIIPTEAARKRDITSSFLTLVDLETGTEVLAMWNYFADNKYEVVDANYRYVEVVDGNADTYENTGGSRDVVEVGGEGNGAGTLLLEGTTKTDSSGTSIQ